MEQRAEILKQATSDMKVIENEDNEEEDLDSLEEIDIEAEKPTEPQELQPVLVSAGVGQVPAGSAPPLAGNNLAKEAYISKIKAFNNW